jgi:bifunctional non-homologous end joining protein LigD
VSTPLRWEEVNDKLDPANFTISNIFNRLNKVGDLWAPIYKEIVDIKKVLAALS